ncbi:MAG: HD domain-containing protein [Lachnospiraceae bacterium]|nr:HD domain-containing protein [Lachnospiraceae bacterium]
MLNVLIAIVAAFISEKGYFRKVGGVIVSFFAFTMIGGGLGSLIPMFTDGLTFDSESLSGILYETGHYSLAGAHIASSIIMDLPDKIITVLLVLIIIRLIPEKWVKYFSFRGWFQKSASPKDIREAEKTPVRILSLQKKILLVLASSLMIVSVIAMMIGAEVFSKTVIKEHTRIAQGTAEIAAAVINGDRIDQYVNSKGTVAGYQDTAKLLCEILNSSTDVSFLYVYRITDEGCQVVFDFDTEKIQHYEIGEIVPLDEGLKDQLPALLSGEKVEPAITDDEFGYLLTAYQPVLDSEGNCTCYVGADVDMNQINAMKRSFYVEMASVFLAFFFVICVFVIWLAEFGIIYPINSIMKCLDSLAHTSDDQSSMDADVKMFRKLGIRTGDEIENLYLSACSMTKNQAEQLRSIRRLSDSTAKMQDGLIITMADLVESRDSDTGAHVQKTAAYVKIIVESLKKKGYYAEKITPKFMSDVVRSAPLHDVGKINIPDEVLNKPGKLTDEEYEIMKTHTTAGKKIMENAISSVEGDSYLKEARNMAAYHHERWDGKGYPEKIHGEVIPLSARIMAVADVFDALTSPRVYKPAFPLEKALAIINEGKGTQFDPKCVEAFMESIDEVKEVMKKYNPGL